MLVYGIAEIKMLDITKYTVRSDKVPKSLSGKKIAVISDVHGVSHGKDNARLFEKLKKTDPDYIVISGDLINGRKSSEIRFAFRFIRRLKRLGVPVIYTFGNHEEKLKSVRPKSYKRLKQFAYKRIVLLNNRSFKPKDADDLLFVGLNLPVWMYHSNDPNDLVKRWSGRILDKADSKDAFKILVAHDPEHYKKYAECGFDVCIAGHLHGGIVYLPFLGGVITPRFQIFTKYAKGCHEFGNMKMIVSGGIGWHDIPFRLFNHPEIVVIKFERISS